MTPKAPRKLDNSHNILANAIQNVIEANDAEEMFLRILSAAQTLTAAEGASIYLLDHHRKVLRMTASTNLSPEKFYQFDLPLGTGITGWVAANDESANIGDMSQDPRFFDTTDHQTGFHTRGYLCVPLTTGAKVIGTVQVLNKINGHQFSEDDQSLLECFGSLVALAIKKNQLHETEIEKHRLDSELKLAEEFQKRLLPTDMQQPENYLLAGTNSTARQISGDYYDWLFCNNKCNLVIADVSGKGPAAGIWMSALSNIIRYEFSKGADILSSIPEIDLHFAKQFPRGVFITGIFAELIGNTLTLSNAGHNPLLVVRNNGSHELYPSQGIPLGILPSLARPTMTLSLHEGDTVVFYTDGVTEARSEEGLMFGEARLIASAVKHRKLAPDKIIGRLFAEIHSFRGTAEQSDDITVMILQRQSIAS